MGLINRVKTKKIKNMLKNVDFERKKFQGGSPPPPRFWDGGEGYPPPPFFKTDMGVPIPGWDLPPQYCALTGTLLGFKKLFILVIGYSKMFRKFLTD